MKSRIEQFPKAVRDELLRLQNISYPQSLDFQVEALKFGINVQRIVPLLSSADGAAVDLGILNRLHSENVEAEVVGLNTGARFNLLTYIYTPDYAGHYDCMHVHPIIWLLATKDTDAVRLAMERFPGPSKQGHTGTVLLCNGIYALFSRDEDAVAATTKRLLTAKESKFFMALYRSIAGIVNRDVDMVSTSINELVDLHYRQNHVGPTMLKFHAIHAHALFNVWVNQYGGEPFPIDNRKKMWDDAFHEYVNDKNHTPGKVFDFSSISPSLPAGWLEFRTNKPWKRS